MNDKKEDNSEEDLDDLLDRTFEKQDILHHKCQMRDDQATKQAEWKKKYRK